jgi:hypothetical protein
VLAIVGVGVIELGLFARTYAVIYLGERDARLEKAWGRLRLEHGLAVAAGTLALGLVITLVSFFDRLKDPRLGVLGLALIAIGFQCASGSFFLSILGLSDDALLRREVRPPADRT